MRTRRPKRKVVIRPWRIHDLHVYLLIFDSRSRSTTVISAIVYTPHEKALDSLTALKVS